MGHSYVEGGANLLCELLEFVAFPFADVVLGLHAQAEIGEILVGVRDVLACLTNEDAGKFATKEHVDKG